jgi:hypothetical protein
MANNDFPVGKGTFIELIKNGILSNSEIFGFFLSEIIAPINLSHPILQLHHKINGGMRTISLVGSSPKRVVRFFFGPNAPKDRQRLKN